MEIVPKILEVEDEVVEVVEVVEVAEADDLLLVEMVSSNLVKCVKRSVENGLNIVFQESVS